MSRIAMIQGMLQRTPNDVFLHFSLAMEHVSAGQADEAVAEFRKCAELDPAYIPAYVEGGKCLRTAGRFDEARAMFQAADKLAAAIGDAHIRDYIRQQLETL